MPVSTPPAAPDEVKTKVTPSSTLVPFTCEWAQDGLRRALEGIVGGSSGVSGYGIGTRWVRYRDAAEQAKVIDYWMKLVEYYCGTDALPPWITGRDTACRVVLRDV
jgi:hypothetical protein